MSRSQAEIELAQRRDAALTAGAIDLAFVESQRLLASIRSRGDRPEEARALVEFAQLLRRAGEGERAKAIDRYLATGFEPKPHHTAHR
ncbi:MAG: hypothetical protein L3K07_00645 [Thermoplasmata archaeon]|nr:hypothetical protein [Thermoplasmata archaeon]